MCPSSCPTKTTKHFSPLSCSCSALKICADAVESRRHAEDDIVSLLLFSPKEFFLSLQTTFFSHFFYLLSSPVPLQKSPNNHFFDKVSYGAFCTSFTYFSYFSWVWELFYFLTFFLFFSSGFGKANSRVWRGPDWLIFAMWHGAGELLMHFFFSGSCDTTLLIPLVDFYGCLL